MEPGTNLKKCCTVEAAEDAVMIVGVANAGLVGSIAAGHLIDKLHPEECAHIYSSNFPPVSVFMDGELKHPFRIYADSKDENGNDKPARFFIATSELPMTKDVAVLHETAHVLVDYAQELNIKTIVALVGFPVEEFEQYDVFYAAEPEIIEKLKKIEGIQPLPKGMIFGIEALVLNETLEREIDGFALIVPVREMFPATRSAAALIDALKKIFDGLDVDTQELIERDDQLQAKLKELVEQVRRSQGEEYTPPPPSKSVNSLFT
ncbi:MAG TPA: PAC2 family protein [Candidatus Lokiarchaeia archaeon]|nr:PAC2 family protein [Candidatus Lokiarchaeia archaeon]